MSTSGAVVRRPAIRGGGGSGRGGLRETSRLGSLAGAASGEDRADPDGGGGGGGVGARTGGRPGADTKLGSSVSFGGATGAEGRERSPGPDAGLGGGGSGAGAALWEGGGGGGANKGGAAAGGADGDDPCAAKGDGPIDVGGSEGPAETWITSTPLVGEPCRPSCDGGLGRPPTIPACDDRGGGGSPTRSHVVKLGSACEANTFASSRIVVGRSFFSRERPRITVSVISRGRSGRAFARCTGVMEQMAKIKSPSVPASNGRCPARHS
jgi:hypothetical protein